MDKEIENYIAARRKRDGAVVSILKKDWNGNLYEALNPPKAEEVKAEPGMTPAMDVFCPPEEEQTDEKAEIVNDAPAGTLERYNEMRAKRMYTKPTYREEYAALKAQYGAK